MFLVISIAPLTWLFPCSTHLQLGTGGVTIGEKTHKSDTLRYFMTRFMKYYDRFMKQYDRNSKSVRVFECSLFVAVMFE